MKKILPILFLSLFIATSCEDDEVANQVTCTTLFSDLASDPFATQMQEVDFANPPSDWKTNCEAYAVKMQALVDADCEDFTQGTVDSLLSETCTLFD